MPKIQNVGVGKYIRNPRGRKLAGSRGLSIEVLKVERSDGNSFLCFPVKDAKASPVTLDTTRYLHISIDAEVEEVTI